MKIPVVLMILVLAVALPAVAGDEVLLRDDFDGPSLDTSKWFVPIGPESFFGRTQIRPPSQALAVELVPPAPLFDRIKIVDAYHDERMKAEG